MKYEIHARQNTKTYPWIGVHRTAGNIVLFVSSRNGTGKGIVLRQGVDKLNPLGYYSEYWCETDFLEFDGSVTLSN